MININIKNKENNVDRELEGEFVIGMLIGANRPAENEDETPGAQFIVGKLEDPNILVAAAKSLIKTLGDVYEGQTGLPGKIFEIMVMDSTDWGKYKAVAEKKEGLFEDRKKEGESNA